MHSIISPAILYWGTPVVLVSSTNPDGTTNISPISAAFWLGHRAVLGFGAESQTPANILRGRECVLNLPSESLSAAVNALAGTTGSEVVSPSKLSRGYRFVRDKWAHARLTPQESDFVRPQRIRQCPVQMECELVADHRLMRDLPDRHGAALAFEVRVLRVHVLDDIRMHGYANRIDPDKWRPMIMSFQELYGLGPGKLADSTLSKVDEEKYRALTKSDVVRLKGDDDDKEAIEKSGTD